MPMRDLHSSIKNVRVIEPQTVGTTGTGRTGKIVDLQGYEGCEFIVQYGSVTATTAVFTVTMKEGSATSALTSVADSDMISTELAAGLGATTARASGVSKNVSKRIGYIGSKRYVNLSVKSTTTAGAVIAVAAIVGHPLTGNQGAGT